MAEGTSEYSPSTPTASRSELTVEITIGITNSFEIRHLISVGRTNDGLGIPSTNGSEVYTEVFIERLL